MTIKILKNKLPPLPTSPVRRGENRKILNKENLNLAKRLRKMQTPEENIIWFNLRAKRLSGYKFKRQYPIGKYIVDFVCMEKMLVIEIDGSGHNIDSQISYDKIRDEYLNLRGFKVIRIWNNDINNNLESVLNYILDKLNE